MGVASDFRKWRRLLGKELLTLANRKMILNVHLDLNELASMHLNRRFDVP